VRGLLMVLILHCMLGWPLAALSAQADAPALQKHVQQLLDAGQADKAYAALLEKTEYEGEPWYERLRGEAALASGHTDEAIARLETYVAANPQQDEPQFLLGRAYEQKGQTDRAVAQYRRIYETNAFEESREKARAELARLGEPPVIPVGERKPRVPPPAASEAVEFAKEKSGLLFDAFLGTGFDTNANSGSDRERYFFYDLSNEQQDSKSWYATGGASVLAGWALTDHVGWRTGISASATTNPSAHFADTQDVSMQMQLRWSGAHQRLSAGLVHAIRTIDEQRSDTAIAAGLKLETLTDVLVMTVSGEGAKVRYPHAALRDVDTFYMRTEVTPAPREDARWVPHIAAVFGFEHEKMEASPFGRKLWGVVAGAQRLLTRRLSLDGEAGYTKSVFDDAFLDTKHRSDDSVQARLYAHWTPHEKSRWEHSFGARYRTVNSNESLYEFDRLVIGYELAGTWGQKEKP
jgi:hypothetical protein